MQVAEPIKLHLPKLFIEKLRNSLQDHPPAWSYNMDYFYSLIHYLIVREIQFKNRTEEFYSIDFKKLKSVTVTNIDRYIKYLVDEKLLQRDNYLVGEKPFYYRLNPVYVQGICTVQLYPDRRAFNGLKKSWDDERHNANRLPPHLQQMRKLFLKVDLDYDRAMDWIESRGDTVKQYYYLTSLERFMDKRSRYFSRNKTNFRLDTNFTCLKKEIREFLVGDWVSIDLVNSQPFFLSQLLYILFTQNQDDHTSLPLIPSHSINNTLPLCSNMSEEDLVKWFGRQVVKGVLKTPQFGTHSSDEEILKLQDSCNSGTFYEDFLLSFEGGSLTRDEVKEIMFAVLFSRNEIYRNNKRSIPYGKEKEKFAKVYPIISAAIKALKRKDHAKLAILLQRIESEIFIDIICLRLVGEGIVPLTIHDSIIVEADKAGRALKICQEVFKEGFGVIPSFHVKQVKSNHYDKAGSNSGSKTNLPKEVASGEPGQDKCIHQEMAVFQSRKSA